MTTNTTNSKAKIILPPGKKLSEDFIKKPIVKIGDLTLDSEDYLYPTFVLAEKHTATDNTTIQVTTGLVIQAEAEEVEKYLRIKQLFTISDYGLYKLQFFIYNAPKSLAETPKKDIASTDYNIFKIVFSTNFTATFPDGIKIEDIDVVEVFLWQVDPKTSRGTVTTVQTQH